MILKKINQFYLIYMYIRIFMKLKCEKMINEYIQIIYNKKFVEIFEKNLC